MAEAGATMRGNSSGFIAGFARRSASGRAPGVCREIAMAPAFVIAEPRNRKMLGAELAPPQPRHRLPRQRFEQSNDELSPATSE